MQKVVYERKSKEGAKGAYSKNGFDRVMRELKAIDLCSDRVSRTFYVDSQHAVAKHEEYPTRFEHGLDRDMHETHTPTSWQTRVTFFGRKKDIQELEQRYQRASTKVPL